MSIVDPQIFIGLNGSDGQLFQVSYTEYKHYWKLIGYKNFGQAKLLPGFEVKTVKQNHTIEMIL